MARALKMFMRGKSVSLLQDILRRMGYEINDQKGLFGADTRDAVKQYQKKQGVKVTGVVDDALMQQMQGGMPVQTVEDKSKTMALPNHQQELDVLVRLLIKKGVFTQQEWDSEKKKVMPSSLI